MRIPNYSSLRTFRTLWIVVVLWCEICVFIAASARCHWPDLGTGEQTHVLLIADPQILNERSYPERSSFLRTISQVFVDMCLRKAWRVAKGTNPDAVIFLGDMMDNGFAEMEITKYQEYVERFRSIFSTSPTLPIYYVPGNHDVGLGNGSDTSSFARSRYRDAFGLLSQHVVLGGHFLLMVDAPALVDEDWRREQAGEARFDGLPQDLNSLKQMRMQDSPDAPLILLSHIPLYRPPNSSCGPLRERGFLPAVRGDGYQTQLSLETSLMLLEEFRPSLIFSGDDHDYCEYTHNFGGPRIPEVTLKSLSIAMGVRQPGFQLLTLSSETRTHAYQHCSVPAQLRIYSWVYAPLFFATIVLVAVRGAKPSAPSRHQKRESLELPAYHAPASRPPSALPRKLGYLRRLMEDIWAIGWPPLVVYVIVAVTVFR